MIEPSQMYFDINVNYPYQSNEKYARSRHSTDKKGRLIIQFFNEQGVMACREIHENIRIIDETFPQTGGSILQEHLDSDGKRHGLERIWSDPETLTHERGWQHGEPHGVHIDHTTKAKEYYNKGTWIPFNNIWLAENCRDLFSHVKKFCSFLVPGKKKQETPSF